MIFVTIFLVCFVILAGVVMFLSKTIEHGEARFDSSGKPIEDKPAHKTAHTGPARPAQKIGAQRIETNKTTNTIGVKDDE